MTKKLVKVGYITIDFSLKFWKIGKLIKGSIKNPWPNEDIKESTILRIELVEQKKNLEKALEMLNDLAIDLNRCE